MLGCGSGVVQRRSLRCYCSCVLGGVRSCFPIVGISSPLCMLLPLHLPSCDRIQLLLTRRCVPACDSRCCCRSSSSSSRRRTSFAFHCGCGIVTRLFLTRAGQRGAHRLSHCGRNRRRWRGRLSRATLMLPLQTRHIPLRNATPHETGTAVIPRTAMARGGRVCQFC